MMTRREMLAAASSAAFAQTPAKKPNVVLIMTDDQGWGDLSCHGNPHLKTPTLDRLAAAGGEFTRFTVSPVCAPTRSSLLTGRYNLRCGVHGVTGGRETMRGEEITLASLLKNAGYRTGLVGKWHLGENYPYVPHAMGFDRFVGFRTGHWNRYWDSPSEENGKPKRLSGYVSDALTDEALRFIGDGPAPQPYFLYLAYNAPHGPYQVDKAAFEKFRAIPGLAPETAAVYAMVENLDANIARVLARVPEQETIVMFLTDNGPQTDRFNGGLRARKGSVYEGGTRAPFFLRWTGRVPAGRKIDRIAAHIDVLPTVLDLCGLPPVSHEIDGKSLAPLLRETTAAEWPDREIFTHQTQPASVGSMFPGAVRTQRWKLVNGKELYNLETDPGEKTDVAAEHREVAARLKDSYEGWFHRVVTPRSFQKPPIPVGYLEENPARVMAPQAALEKGAAFANKNGYAHDWITGLGEASWQIDVRFPGEYEVAVLTVGEGTLDVSGVVKPVSNPATPIPLPDLVRRNEASEMPWQPVSFGKRRFEKGVQTLRVSGSGGAAVKEVHLKRIV